MGPDKIPPYIYKGCGNFLLKPLKYIFNLCLSSSTVPTAWKVTKVVPTPKKINTTEVSEHRPIAMPSVPAKIFESIIHSRIFSQVKHLIANNQHGFYTSRGTHTSLADFAHMIVEQLDQSIQVDTIYTDFQKAFDKVSHKILIDKIKRMGATEGFVRLLTSYLDHRKQYVTYNYAESARFECPSGVPQGSNLGPLLFLIFINDVVLYIRYSNILLYADDIKLFQPIACLADSDLLQQDLNSLTVWSEQNALPFNLGKCEKITFTTKKKRIIKFDYTLCNTTLRETDSVKDLGVIIDKTFSFNKHIQSKITEAKRNLKFICRNTKQFRNVKVTIVLYYALVRSVLEYCMIIWDPTADTTKNLLERIQSRFLKYLYFRLFGYYPTNISYDDLLEGFEFTSLYSRRKQASLLFLYDVLNGRVKDPNLLSRVALRVPVLRVRSMRQIHANL